MNYHVGRNGQQLGVYSEETIRGMLQRGELRAEDLGWCEGQGDWQTLGQLFGAATPPPISGGSFPPPPPTAGAHAPGGFRLPPPKPKNNLVPAILVTLFCCLPFGIASLIFASQVDSKYAGGDYAGAESSLAKSKLWMWWAFGVGLAVSIVWFSLTLIGAMAGAHGGR